MALQRTSGFLRSRFTLPLAVLAAGVALSIGMGLAARQEIERGAQQRFDAQATDAARKVEDRFDAYTEVLIGLRALFNTTEDVSREQFRQYVAGLRLASHFPGFQVLNYAPYVAPADKAAFERRLRGDTSLETGFAAQIAVVPPGERRGYHPLTLIEPLAGNENAIGRDLAAVPTALKALEQARDTGGVTSSGRKIQIKGRESDIGLAMRLPVYRPNQPLDTLEQRRAAYLGSVGAGFRIADMMRAVGADDVRAGRRLQLYDAGASTAHVGTRIETRIVAPRAGLSEDLLLYDSAAAQLQPAQVYERTFAFELGGRSWLVRVSEDARLVVGRLDRSIPWLIWLCGTAISLLLAGIVYSLSTSRQRAEGIAHSMTRNLRTSQRRLDEAQHLASLGSWILDQETGALFCSDEAIRIFGLDRGELHTDLATLLSRVPAEERGEVERQIAQASRSQQRAEFEHRLVLPDGTERWVHVIVQLAEESGKVALRGTVRDDTQRRKVALRLKLEHDVAQLLVADGDTEAVVARALETLCLHLRWDCAAFWAVQDSGIVRCGAIWHAGTDAVLEQFVRISRSLSYRPDEGSLGRAWVSGEAVAVETASTQDHFTRDALASQAGLALGLVVPMVAGGRATALELFSRTPRATDAETVDSLRAIALQITQYEQRKQAEQTLRYVATHDALTGLANRTSLQRDLARAIKRSNRHQKRFAVLFVDIDRFKRINDTLGHGAGDAMIKACGERLAAVLREDDAVARFGGDEFVLVVENLSKASDAAVVAEKVLACCAEPFVIDERELHVTASIGVSVYPEDGADSETLLKNADTAMYRAKDKGRGGYQFYAAQMNAQGSERLTLEAGLRRAIERGELELHYQPKMDLRTQRIAGVEALMRWRHPVLGLVSPAQFIPIAEETGLIVEMGKWALQTACADARDWQQRGLPPVQMSVNLSPRQLNSPQLIADINEVLNRTGLNPALLELEITESAMMKNPEQAALLLQEIRHMGVGLAIDDFGTGYSSLSYLKRFPLTTVKIDRSFVNDLSQDRDAEALTDGIVTLAHGLRMKVVAEGVETAAQLAYLRAHDCDEVQGYWLCRPVPAEEVCAFMARHLRSQFAAPVAA
jgi:diguanylate cyclase (GGDEF)-like protein/PAS domain S-box-containing protein